VPGAGLERATARSSAECSPRLSYPGTTAIAIVTNLSLSFQNTWSINKMIENFFKKVLELKNVPRQGWKEKLEIDNLESVADHSYSTTVMSMILSDMEGLNTEKIVRMALLHDLAESITGDITPDSIRKNEKINKENIAMKQILKNLPDKIAEAYFEIWNEYQKNFTEEAILLHSIDKLEMAFQAKFYQDKGISKEKLQTFFNTANKEIKNENLRKILSNFME
tara:strand:- start:141 stop:809 length:669 start_codon:yes stop_codon:yes gene_type:complete